MTDKLLACESCGSVNFECCACAAAVDVNGQHYLQNRAAVAEQQVAALTQRLDMANRLNTDARQQLAKLRLLPCGFYGHKWLGEDEFAAIVEALK